MSVLSVVANFFEDIGT